METIETSNTLNLLEITHRRRSTSSCLYGEFHCFSTVKDASVTLFRCEIVPMCSPNRTSRSVGAGRYRGARNACMKSEYSDILNGLVRVHDRVPALNQAMTDGKSLTPQHPTHEYCNRMTGENAQAKCQNKATYLKQRCGCRWSPISDVFCWLRPCDATLQHCLTPVRRYCPLRRALACRVQLHKSQKVPKLRKTKWKCHIQK